MFNRRHFLLSGSAAIGTLLPSINATAQDVLSSALSLSSVATSDLESEYRQKIGQSFLARSEHGSTWLTLVEVESYLSSTEVHQFALVFSTDAVAASDVYQVTHLRSLRTQAMRLELSDSNKQQMRSQFALLQAC